MYRLSLASRALAAACLLLAALMLSPATMADDFQPASFAAEGWMMAGDERAHIRMFTDWQQRKTRVEMVMPDDGRTMVVIGDMATGTSLLFHTGDKLPSAGRTALKQQTGETYDQIIESFEAMRERRTGDSKQVHGEECSLFRAPPGDYDQGEPGLLCLTPDGIAMQQLSADGSSVRMELTFVARGEQDPALFELPPGYRVER